MTRTGGKFLRSLLGQLTSVLLGLLLILLGLFAAYRYNEKASHQRVIVLSNQAIRSLARDELLARGQRLATQLANSVAEPMSTGDTSRIGWLVLCPATNSYSSGHCC